MIKVKILFFASARVAAGNIKETIIELNDNDNYANTDNADAAMATTATTAPMAVPAPNTKTIRYTLAKLYPNLSSLVLDEESITLALNEEYIPYGEVLSLKDGDVLALIPPISGG